MDENKMEVIAEQAKEMVSDAVKGLDGKEMLVIGLYTGAAMAIGAGIYECARKVAPKVKAFCKRVFGKKPEVVAAPEAVEK